MYTPSLNSLLKVGRPFALLLAKAFLMGTTISIPSDLNQ
jgi:hypothetical protein